MYAIENKDVPRFRRFMDDMYYSQAPSKFPIYTAYCEVLLSTITFYVDFLCFVNMLN